MGVFRFWILELGDSLSNYSGLKSRIHRIFGLGLTRYNSDNPGEVSSAVGVNIVKPFRYFFPEEAHIAGYSRKYSRVHL